MVVSESFEYFSTNLGEAGLATVLCSGPLSVDYRTRTLGSVAVTDLSLGYCIIEGRTIARVDVRRGTQPTFASRKSVAREVYFVRLNNATEELSGSALLAYEQKHWPQ